MITGIRYTMTISSISELKLVLLKSSEANFLFPGYCFFILVLLLLLLMKMHTLPQLPELFG
jgi:hypothetical protein